MPNRYQKAAFFPWPALLSLLLCVALLRTASAEVNEALPPVNLPVFTDLHAVAAQARARHLPMLVMFSMDGCSYCTVVEEDFLKPMLRSGDYKGRVIMGMVKLDSYSRIRDFGGKMVKVSDLAQRYGAPMTPTVIFVNPEGHELSPKLIGMTTVDFYGGYLDQGIDQSLHKMRPTNTAMPPSL